MYANLADFTSKTLQWIEAEHIEERKEIDYLLEELSPAQLLIVGYAIGKLHLVKQKLGIANRTIVTFAGENIAGRLKQGDQVGIHKNTQAKYTQAEAVGVIEKMKDGKIRIMLEKGQTLSEYEGLFAIAVHDNDVTYKRYKKVLAQMQTEYDNCQLLKVIFEPQQAQVIDEPFDHLLGQTYQQLNDDQQLGILRSLNNKYISLIHGPPGTGKTRTVCEFMKQAVMLQNHKILACAPSNVAVDNMVERLSQIAPQIKFCRIGNPGRMSQNVKHYCIDVLSHKTSSYAIMKELKTEIQKLDKKINRAGYAEKKELRKERQQLEKEKAIQEEMAQIQVIEESQIVFATNTGGGQGLFRHLTKKITFDVVVIDECAQSLEVACWIPLLKGRKMVLAGDHQQLPPTIKSQNTGLAVTLFERVQTMEQYCTLLRTQYRMNTSIMQWASETFYNEQLIADKSVAQHTTNDLIEIQEDEPIVLLFIDTAGCDMWEGQQIEELQAQSKYNTGEAGLVQVLIEELTILGIKIEDIGIISPYNAQVQLIRTKTSAEVSSVDGFQGREKECIIISMVRSNDINEVGFLAEHRRMNVAVTRAKRFVCLVGNSDTISSDPILKQMIEYFQKHGSIRSAHQYLGDDRVEVTIIQQKVKEHKKKTVQTQKQQQNQIKKQIQNEVKNQELQDQLEIEVINFIESNLEQKEFPQCNPFQRMLLHSLAEKYNLKHVSVGTEKIKTLILIKQNVETNKLEQFEPKVLIQVDQLEKVIEPQEDVKQSQQLKENLSTPIVKKQQQQQQPTKKQPKQQQKQKKTKEELEREEDEYFANIPLLDITKCAFMSKLQCNSSINLLSLSCKYCQKKFCSKHHLAEEHGCDEAARLDARQKFVSEKFEHDKNKVLLQAKLKETQQSRNKKKNGRNYETERIKQLNPSSALLQNTDIETYVTAMHRKERNYEQDVKYLKDLVEPLLEENYKLKDCVIALTRAIKEDKQLIMTMLPDQTFENMTTSEILHAIQGRIASLGQQIVLRDNMIKQLNEHINQLNIKIEDQDIRNRLIEEQKEEEIQVRLQQHQNNFEELKLQNQALQEEIIRMNQNCQLMIIKVDEMNEKAKELEKQIFDLRQKNLELQKLQQGIDRQHQKDRNEQARQYSEFVQQMRLDHSNEISRLNASHEQKIIELEQVLQTKSEKIEEIEFTFGQQMAKYTADIKRIKQQNEQLELISQNAKKQELQNLDAIGKALRDKREQEGSLNHLHSQISQLKSEISMLKLHICQLDSNHEQEITNLKQKLSKQKNKYKDRITQQLNDFNKQMELALRLHDQEIKEIKFSHIEEVKKIEEDQIAQHAEIRGENSLLRDKIEDLEFQIKDLDNMWDFKYVKLQMEYLRLTQDYETLQQ